MTQKQLLEDAVRGILHDEADVLDTYSRDASIFQVQPSVVFEPVDLSDLCAAVNRVRELKGQGQDISLTPRAAGTCMSGGSLTQSVMVDMTKHFMGIHHVDAMQKRVVVGAGTYYRDIEHALNEHGLLFPPYTSSKDLCTIGGMIGNNASGEKSLRYGATINWVRRLWVVLADGNEYEFGPLTPEQLEAKKQLDTNEGRIYREMDDLITANWESLQRARPNVRKNAAGYALWRVWNDDKTEFNLARLFVGAQGTLGFITGAELHVVSRPKHTRMVVIPVADLHQLADALQFTLAQQPEGLEVYDKHTYELAKEFMLEQSQLASVANGKEMVLFAQFADPTEDQTNHHARVCAENLRKRGYKETKYVDDPAEAEAHWAIRRASYKLLKDHAPGEQRAAPFIEDTIVNPVHYVEFLSALETILSDYKMTYTYAGHIGDGSIRLIPLVDLRAENAALNVFDLARRVYDLVFAFDGSMSVDHNDGLIRTPFLETMYGADVIRLFERTKQIFDPSLIFNPGKKVLGDIRFAMQHVLRTNND